MSNTKFVNATKTHPAKSSYAIRISPSDWDKHEPEIRALRNAGKTKREILQRLSSHRGFSPSKGQLQKKFEEWSLVRNREVKIDGFPADSVYVPRLDDIEPAHVKALVRSGDFDNLLGLSTSRFKPDDVPVTSADLNSTAESLHFEGANIDILGHSEQETKVHFLIEDQTVGKACRSAISSLLFKSEFVENYIFDNQASALQEGVRIEFQHDQTGIHKSAIWHAIGAGHSLEYLLRAAFILREVGKISEAFELTFLHICLASLQNRLGIRSLCQLLLRCILLDTKRTYRQLIQAAISCTKDGLPANLRSSFLSITTMMSDDTIREALSDQGPSPFEWEKFDSSISRLSSDLALPCDTVADITCYLIRSYGASDKPNSRSTELQTFENLQFATKFLLRRAVLQLQQAFITSSIKLKLAVVELATGEDSWLSNYERLFDLITSVPTVQTRFRCTKGQTSCSKCRYHSFWSTSSPSYVGAICSILTERIIDRLTPQEHLGKFCAPVFVSLTDIFDELVCLSEESWVVSDHGSVRPLCMDYVFRGPASRQNLILVRHSLGDQYTYKDVIKHVVEKELARDPSDAGVDLAAVSGVNQHAFKEFCLCFDAFLQDDFDPEMTGDLDVDVPQGPREGDLLLDASPRLAADDSRITFHTSPWKELSIDAFEEGEARQVSEEKERQLAALYCPSLTSSKSSGYRHFKSAGLAVQGREGSIRSHIPYDMISLVSSTDAMTIAS